MRWSDRAWRYDCSHSKRNGQPDRHQRLERVLADSGYRVLESADGREALRVFEQHAGTIDLLLRDVVMPGMGGRELAETAITGKPGLKVIYMSGYADDAMLNTGQGGEHLLSCRHTAVSD